VGFVVHVRMQAGSCFSWNYFHQKRFLRYSFCSG
jgi:hypothetical protein